MSKNAKKNYLIGEICKNVISCDFRKDFRGYFLKYFPDKSECWNFIYKLKPIGKIKKNDIRGVWENLRQYYSDVAYIKNLRHSINGVLGLIEGGVIRMDKLDYEEDYLVANYLEYWKNLSCLVVYGYKKRFGDKIEENIRMNGDLLAVREMRINRREMMGLLFWGNLRRRAFKTMRDLEGECDGMGLLGESDMIKIRVYFFDKNDGKGRDDMDFMEKKIKLELGDKENMDNRVYGMFNYDDAVSFGGLVFNVTNFRYFNEVCWGRFLDMEGGAGKLMLIGIRNYLLERVDGMDMKRFLVFSSMILYLYGLRKPSDMDIIGFDRPLPKGNLREIYEKYGTTGENILGVGELSVRGYGEWRKGGKKEHLDNWFGIEWPRMFGAMDMDDMVFNPRYYLSLMGMKVMIIDADIERRRIRYRAASYADLIAYNRFMPEAIEIERPPSKYIVGGEEKSYESEEEKRELMRKIKNYLRLRYDIRMTIEEISVILGITEGYRVKERDEKIGRRLRVYEKLRRKGMVKS